MYKVILCGGSGTRLWPLSRKNSPKQFVDLGLGKSLFSQTLNRFDDKEKFIIISNKKYLDNINDTLKKENIKAKKIIEPCGKNTAPAIAMAALDILHNGDDELMLVSPSDHIIKNPENFLESISNIRDLAEEGFLITFGVEPTSPEPGYGYIKKGTKIRKAFNVECFVEKPTIKKAVEYLLSESYLWNSGIFLFKPSSFLRELKKYARDIYDSCLDVYEKTNVINNDRNELFLHEEFNNCRSESIDYAVMEHSQLVLTTNILCLWSDAGSWSSIWKLSNNKDENLNVVMGDVLTYKTSNSLIYSQEKVITTIGIKNLIIIETSDSILVSDIDSSEQVKELVNQIKESKHSKLL